MATSSLQPLGSTTDTSGSQSLPLAIAGFLANFKGRTRVHAESDLSCFLRWCQGADLSPLAGGRGDLELYLRWMQSERRFKPSTVSRRLSVVAGFYRTCVIDGLSNNHPPNTSAAPVSRPNRPPWGCPTCSSRRCSAAPATPTTPTTSPWWPCSGCSAYASSKPPDATSRTSMRSMDTACSASTEKATRLSSHRSHPPWPEPLTEPETNVVPDPSCVAAPARA